MPSPNDHDQSVGEPLDRSVKAMAVPGLATDAETSNAATMTGVPGVAPETVSVFDVDAETPLRDVINVTVYAPGVAYFFDGLCSVEDEPSPKLQSQAVGAPPD